MECLKLADAAPTAETRAYWTQMAQLWHDLATHLEEVHATSESSSVFPPLRNGESPQELP